MKAQRVRSRTKRAAAVVLVLGLLLAGCNADDSDGSVTAPTTPSASVESRPTSTGSITVLEPTPGEQVPVGDLTVRVDLQGATIAEEATVDLRADTGHIHVALDGQTLTLLAGLTYVVEDVGPGSHILNVEFAANDHGPFDPPVIVVVPFTAG